MVSRTAFNAFCFSESPADVEKLVGILTRLWVNALKLPDEAERSRSTKK
jgi:hypothetical protein